MTAQPRTEASGTAREPHAFDWRLVGAVSLGAATLITLLVAAFTWPASELEPRSVPIAVVAPAEAGDGIAAQLAATAGEEAFDVTAVSDRDAAVAAIEDRQVYGAVVAGPDQTEVLVAGAASPTVAQLLGQNAGSAAGGAPVVVTDVVPSADGDPRGVVFNSGALPLALSGIAVGALASLALRRTTDRLVVATLVSIAGGLAVTGLLQDWLDALSGSYWANAGVVTLGILAIALPIVGLFHIVQHAGIALVALTVLLVGNPLSGVTSAPELLPLGWLGQLLPPGAVGSALRGTSYFDGAGTAMPLTVLIAWAAGGLALALVPRRAR